MIISAFRTHIKKRLGYPAINVEVTEEQIDILIADAVQKFTEVHFDGLDEGFIFLALEKDVTSYTLPNNIHSVLDILGMSNSFSLGEPLLVTPYTYNDISSMSHDMVDMNMFRQSYQMFQDELKITIRFEFNSTTHLLKLIEKPRLNRTVAVKVHSAPESLELIYDNKWVQKYSTALVKYQWGSNLSKYIGGVLPGGVSLNFDLIMSEAKESIEKLEEQLYEEYQEPIDFYCA